MASSVPSPKFILRGHKAAVHVTAFVRNNERLVTGDAEGYTVLWDLTVMRPKAVWRAHENSILGIRGWGNDKIITHGRDHKLLVWKLAEEDEQALSTALPLDGAAVTRLQPWILHLLEVNTMNFCSFSACKTGNEPNPQALGSSAEILIAVPNTLASEAIDIYQLPSQKRLHTVTQGAKNGMAMCLSIFIHEDRLTLISASENGFVSVQRLSPTGDWILTYRAQAHSQPILSLDIEPNLECFFTSGADAVIAKHPLPTTQQEVAAPFNPDERIIEEIDEEETGKAGSLLSEALKGERGQKKGALKVTFQEWKHPIKQVNTKHSGQQSIQVRSDGGIFATAGWDSKIRVYSCKTLKELAMLKWHNDGAYAVGFSDIGPAPAPTTTASANPGTDVEAASAISAVETSRMSVRERRNHRAKTAHWLAAGAKDGKVSLWDIY